MQFLTCFVLALCCIGALGQEIQFGAPLDAITVSTVRSMLYNQIRQIWVNHQAGVVCSSCLVSSFPQRQEMVFGRRVNRFQIDAALTGYPTDVRTKLKAVAFGTSTTYHMFRYTVDTRSRYGYYDSYLATARRVGEDVDIAILGAKVTGSMVQKYNIIRWRTCKKRMWWTCCCQNHVRYEARGFSSSELAAIQNSFIAESVRVFDSAHVKINF